MQFWEAAADRINPPALGKRTSMKVEPCDAWVSAAHLRDLVHTILDGVRPESLHGTIEELLLRERLRARHINAIIAKEPASPPHSVPEEATEQMTRSQSALQINKITESAPDAYMSPRAAQVKRSAAPSPDESPMKRSQSALEVSKFERVGSCGNLASHGKMETPIAVIA